MVANLCWPQRSALGLGVLLVVWGVVDLIAGRSPLGVLHVVTGVVAAASATSMRASRPVGSLMAVVFLVVFAFGVGEAGPGGSAMDAGVVGNGLHLLIGFASVAVAASCAWCQQRSRPTTRSTASPGGGAVSGAVSGAAPGSTPGPASGSTPGSASGSTPGSSSTPGSASGPAPGPAERLP
ncbi:hypothetical protein Q5530_21830 [Saccharothrix sp. BKS2]|uniref:hypothetical protein n=1 Tax=Saccharothrix sp. BKS2 TaxID=3064400 RepID=UPI0039E9390B